MISVSPLAVGRLSRTRATNPELSAGKANVIAIIEAFGFAIMFRYSARSLKIARRNQGGGRLPSRPFRRTGDRCSLKNAELWPGLDDLHGKTFFLGAWRRSFVRRRQGR